MAVDHKYRCQIFTKHCKAIRNMATMRNFIMCPGDIRYVQYVAEQYILRKSKKVTVITDMSGCKSME